MCLNKGQRKDERYQMTEHGIAIRERYTVTLLSAEAAIEMAQWLLSHYVELEKLRRRLEEEQKKKGARA